VKENARLEIVRVQEQHAEEVAEFIRVVWDPAATAASVLAARAAGAQQNVAEPGVPAPTWIAIQGGKALGYVTTIPVRFWNGSFTTPGYWIKGLMVLPAFRGGPIGYHILKAAASALPISGGLAVAPPARRLFTALGYTDCGAIDNWLRPLQPRQMMRQLDVARMGLSHLPSWTSTVLTAVRKTGLGAVLGWSSGWAFRMSAAVLRGNNAGFSTEILEATTEAYELTALWERCSPSLRYAVARDPAYLIPRYPQEHGLYRWIGVRRDGALVGLAILKIPRENGDERLAGIRVATVSDLLFDVRDTRVGFAVLAAVEREASTLRSDAIVAATSAESVVRLFRRQCYFMLGGSVHLLFRATEQSAIFSYQVREWWLQRGDGGADDAL